MNTLAIILGVILVVLIFILYQWYISTATILKSSITDLKTQIPVITTISNPTNTQYAYGMWVYVNNWDNTQNKVFLTYSGAMNVYLMKDRPTLCVDVKMSDETTASTIITTSFPLQKWVYIIASLDNQFLDVYLDGKLVKSSRLTNSTGSIFPKPPPLAPQVFLGNSLSPNTLYNGITSTPSATVPTTATQVTASTAFNAYISIFTRWTTAMDPGTAWRYYMKGNGQTSLLGNMSTYGVQMQVIQNNVVASSYRIF